MLSIATLQPTVATEEKSTRIAVLSETVKHLPIPSEVSARVFHAQYLKSSLFSARIEGNVLTLDDLSPTDWKNPKQKGKKELANIMRALTLLPRWSDQLSRISLQEIHTMVMQGIDTDAGKLRREQTAIFDAFGNAVYLTPDRETMDAMLDAFFTTWNAIDTQKKALLALAPLHLFFEKTHPFVDGNGRVGRVLMHLLMHRFEISPKNVIIPVDQYFERYKEKYYFYFDQSNKTLEEFQLFLLDSIIWGFEEVLDEIQHTTLPQQAGKTLNLLPRRQEIFEIIKDHPYCSLDLIARRFPTIPRRTLSFDVSDLLKKDLVVKNGTTRGVTYSAKV